MKALIPQTSQKINRQTATDKRNSMTAPNVGIRRIVNATRYSMLGLRAAWKNEAAFRQELTLCLMLVPLAFWLGRSALEQGLLISTLFIVLISELLNSAIEAITDRVGFEIHELAGRAKDMGSAAVFVSLVLVVIVWSLVAYDRFC